MNFLKKSIFFLLILPNSIAPTSPTLNKYDTFGFSSPEGVDNFPRPWASNSDMSFDFQVCPYYLEASSSLNLDGSATVGLFEEAGPINLPGMYYNLVGGIFDPDTTLGASNGPTVLQDMFPTGYVPLRQGPQATPTDIAVSNLPTNITPVSSFLLKSFGGKDKFTVKPLTAFEGLLQNLQLGVNQDANRYVVNNVATRASAIAGQPLTEAARKLFYPNIPGFTIVPLNPTSSAISALNASYKRHGLRLKAQAFVMPGVKVWAKGGICQYKVKTNLLEMITQGSLTSLGAGNELLYMNLFRKDKLEEAFNAFNINAGNFSDWSFEDTFAAVEFSAPVTFLSPGAEGESSKENVKLWPTLTAGVWMPTARKPDITKSYNLFEVPVSNHTHTGGSISGSVSLELPGLLFVNSGLSVSFFNTKTIDKYMLPTNAAQSGVSLDIFQVSRKPGKTYLAWIAMFAKNFFENWTAHAQYSITNHLQDEITVLDTVKAKIFDPATEPGAWSAFQKHLRHTAWTVHEFQAGLFLAMTPNLEFGATFKMVGMGENVPKTNTIMASIKILF